MAPKDATAGAGGLAGARDPNGDAPLIGSSGPVDSASEGRESMRRIAAFHSPHQSSSRTCGHTPSIMYVFWLIGCSIGAPRRHCPHCTPRASVSLPPCRS